ncbi:hypothetical protein WN944_006225 [Citrus x changshan-huyou]|uniref:Cytochrome P450 n=1 Tax=Citrus x changshan-huyou TaxID=2935761 RepID=A0AAP0MLF4_9ROSI
MAFVMLSWLCENLTAIVTSIAVVVLAAVIIGLTKTKAKKATAPPLPPGPRGLPLVGYLPFLGTDLYKSLTKLAEAYGPIYKFWLANKLFVVVSSSSIAKEMVRDKDTIFSNRQTTVATLTPTLGGNDIVFSPYGAQWRRLRKAMVGEMMTNSSLDSCSDLRKQVLKNTIRDLYNNKIGKPVDIGEVSVSTSLNALENMLWGGGTGSGGHNDHTLEMKQLLDDIMELQGVPNISDIFPVLSRFDLQGVERKCKEIALWVERFFNSAIEKRKNLIAKGTLKFDGRNKDFLQIFIEMLDGEDSSISLNRTELIALLLDIILGGTDTTTTIMEWTLTKLLQYPVEMKKVQAELAEIVGLNNNVEESHLPKLKYLDATVKETFRLHTPSKLLPPRTPSQTTTLGGYTIPKGATVILNLGTIHTDPQLWDNPLEFRPERFLNDPDKFDYTGNNFQYMPFGSGRRICAGLPLAERLVMFVLASLLHSFDWRLPYGEKLDLSYKYGLVIKKKKPLVAVPKPRLANSELYK